MPVPPKQPSVDEIVAFILATSGAPDDWMLRRAAEVIHEVSLVVGFPAGLHLVIDVVESLMDSIPEGERDA